ncbi:core protein [Trebouxia sp. C0009 RCD-2024]
MVAGSLQATQSSLVFGRINTVLNSPSRTAAILHRRRRSLGSAVTRPDCSICSLTCQWQGPAHPRMQPALKRKSLLRAVTPKGWDQTTSRCVELSTIAFIFLLLPQVVKNYLSASSGNSEALAVLSWVGYLTSLFGNVLLLGCFVDKQEGGATAVQAIGAIANYAMLTQIWLANLMPSAAFLPLTALMASAAVVNGCKFCNMLNSSSGQGLWRNWQDFLGVLGIAMLPQVL